MSTMATTAIDRCLKAYYDACAHHDALNDFSPESLERVRLAWREAMPFLTSDPDAIDRFITCVAHGLVLKVFSEQEASRLFYAAQTAIANRRARTQSALQQSKSNQPQATPSPSPSAAPQVPPPQVAQVPVNSPACHVDGAAIGANSPKQDKDSDKPTSFALSLCHSVTAAPPSLTEQLTAPQVPYPPPPPPSKGAAIHQR